MFPPRFSRAVTVAFYCLVAQLFLSLAALIVGTAVFAIIELDLRVFVIIPVAWFAIYVGGTALHHARRLVVGLGPLL